MAITEGITAIREEDITAIMGTASVIAGDIMDLVEELMVAPVVAVSAIKVTGVIAVDTTIPIERNTIAILIASWSEINREISIHMLVFSKAWIAISVVVSSVEWACNNILVFQGLHFVALSSKFPFPFI